MGIFFDGIKVGPGETKISQFDVESVSAINEDILGFEVPVDNSIGVAEFQG